MAPILRSPMPPIAHKNITRDRNARFRIEDRQLNALSEGTVYLLPAAKYTGRNNNIIVCTNDELDVLSESGCALAKDTGPAIK